MRTSIGITEIQDDGQKDKNVRTNSDGRFCSRSIRRNPKSPRICERTVDQKLPHQPHEVQISNPVKKLRPEDESTECFLDRLPEDIVQDILSRMSISDLLKARATCRAWHHTISSCKIFQLLYDQRNRESWIALTSDPKNPYDFGFFNKNPSKWYFIPALFHFDRTKCSCWRLQAAADGLMLFVSTEGKIMVINHLTKRIRLLPDTKVSPRLRLQSSLKKKLGQNKNNSAPSKVVQSWVSIHLVVESAQFKVMVWGELRSTMVHALVYSSSTDKWIVRSCPDINFRFFRGPFHSTAVGDTIFFMSENRSILATYNTETALFAPEQMNLLVGRWHLRTAIDKVQPVKLLVHKSQVFLLGIIFGYTYIGGSYATLLGLWQATPNTGIWNLLTTETLATSIREPPYEEVAAAYDGEQNVTVIPKTRGWKVRFLNLDTKEWTTSDEGSQAWRLSSGNAAQDQITYAAQDQITFSAPFMAFHMKLKFCTVI